LYSDFQKITIERDDLARASEFLETKLTETSRILGIIEEERRQDQLEMKKMRE